MSQAEIPNEEELHRLDIGLAILSVIQEFFVIFSTKCKMMDVVIVLVFG